jgi:hypothetical protein
VEAWKAWAKDTGQPSYFWKSPMSAFYADLYIRIPQPYETWSIKPAVIGVYVHLPFASRITSPFVSPYETQAPRRPFAMQ